MEFFSCAILKLCSHCGCFSAVVRVLSQVNKMEAFASGQTTECILGIDLGATSLRVARVDAQGGQFLSVPTPSAGDAERTLLSLLSELSGSMKAGCVGLSRAPAIDQNGFISVWPNQPHWNGL